MTRRRGKTGLGGSLAMVAEQVSHALAKAVSSCSFTLSIATLRPNWKGTESQLALCRQLTKIIAKFDLPRNLRDARKAGSEASATGAGSLCNTETMGKAYR